MADKNTFGVTFKLYKSHITHCNPSKSRGQFLLRIFPTRLILIDHISQMCLESWKTLVSWAIKSKMNLLYHLQMPDWFIEAWTSIPLLTLFQSSLFKGKKFTVVSHTHTEHLGVNNTSTVLMQRLQGPQLAG